MYLSGFEKTILSGSTGQRGDQMALEIVAETARMLGAERLVEIESSHIDGCLYHGDSGVLFCEKLVTEGARIKVPTTTNVGALNLLKPDQTRLPPEQRKMAFRLMVAHEKMGCTPSWTCAPYQAGMRPTLGQQVAWGESNAVAFTNTVLGARTNRYGDFLDIACAISGRAPYYGLHKDENRIAEMLIDVSGLSPSLISTDAFFPVLGAMIGRLAGETVCVVDGMPKHATDDQLKALCAGAASTGAVALIHITGITPEAPDAATALGGLEPKEIIHITHDMVIEARNSLSLAKAGPIDSVALGSPHFSNEECRSLLTLANGQKFKVPVYICLGRHTLEQLEADNADKDLRNLGAEFVVDTCVVVTPILPESPGVMMTNSAKFAHYATGNTGHAPVFGTLFDCVKSAQAGHVIWDQGVWG
ncbi:DUF521 domain-containing protein [Amylibacter sp. SFDW26]|uniref:aconitase X n=1 Tax=Amylibacter sp. SFDW26 TaxID=2652722 RepID=UPI0012625418|nr:aconitase X catalytic domain-containing protein [Amylibacter sp. SFDW26]KAB7614490.1 DUF521 domain-containing protein [Amylibacter sp. SFDW26]